MKYPHLLALIFLTSVVSVTSMEKEKDAKRKVRSISTPVPRLSDLGKIEKPMDTPTKKISPSTEAIIKKDSLPAAFSRPSSPRSSPRKNISSPRITNPKRSATASSYPEDAITKALSNSKLKHKQEEK